MINKNLENTNKHDSTKDIEKKKKKKKKKNAKTMVIQSFYCTAVIVCKKIGSVISVKW